MLPSPLPPDFKVESTYSFFVLPPLVQTPPLKFGGRGEGKTWFKFSGVLADLDRKNTHSFVLPLSRPSDQSTAMNIATQCLSQFARLFVHLVLPFCHSVCAYPFFSSLLSCPSGATVGPPMYWANTTHMIQGSTMTSTCQHIATLQCFNRRISYPESMSVG